MGLGSSVSHRLKIGCRSLDLQSSQVVELVLSSAEVVLSLAEVQMKEEKEHDMNG